VMSYRDHIDLGIVCDRELVGDAWELLHGTAAALEEMCEVICGSRRPTAKSTGVGRFERADDVVAPRETPA
jgi:hypothetical protein